MKEKGYVQGTCPHCGAKIPSYVAGKWLYGSPLRTCKKCGTRYIDSRYHEIALEGIRAYDISVKPSLRTALLGLVISLISAGVLYVEWNYQDYYHPMFFYTIPAGMLMVLWGIIDAVRTKLGSKTKKMEKLRKESIERLSDKNYAHDLAARGFYIPEEYL